MKINRDLQNIILIEAANVYPRWISDNFIKKLNEEYGEDTVDTNLFYLQEHGLINTCIKIAMDGNGTLLSCAPIKATNTGVDFILDDGGISAILKTVTVKLHNETLFHLLEKRIHDADIAPKEKSRLVEGLRGLPVDAIKHLTMKLLDKGVESSPNLIQLIGTFLQ